MRFFTQFPKTSLKIGDENTDTAVIDIYRHVDINEKLIDDITTYRFYDILDGERPDTVSTKLYTTPDFHWSFFIINEHLKDGLNAWPQSYSEFESFIERKYDEYSVLEFWPWYIPNNLVNEDLAEGIITRNSFGSLDLESGKYKLIDSTTDHGTNIITYDTKRLQIWVKDIPNMEYVANGYKSYYLDYDYADEEEKEEWLSNEILPWVEETNYPLYLEIVNDPTINDDDMDPWIRGSITPTDEIVFDRDSSPSDDTYITGSIVEADKFINDVYSPLTEYFGDVFEVIVEPPRFTYTFPIPLGAPSDVCRAADEPIIYEWFYSSVTEFPNISLLDILYDRLKDIKFETDKSWWKSQNAPFTYFDVNDQDLNAYSHYGDYIVSDPDEVDVYPLDYITDVIAEKNNWYRTYYQEESNINDSKKRIRILRPSDINEFADRYKELLNE